MRFFKFFIGVYLMFFVSSRISAAAISKDSLKPFSFLGIDVGKTIFPNIFTKTRGSFALEVDYRFSLKRKIFVYASAGYNDFRFDHIYPNVNQRSTGGFGKLGIELPLTKLDRKYNQTFVAIGFSLAALNVRNFGNFRIPGDYFETPEKKYDLTNWHLGTQIYLQAITPVYKDFFIGIKVFSSYLLNSATPNSLENIRFNMPGMGYFHLNRSYSAGLNFQIIYQLR